MVSGSFDGVTNPLINLANLVDIPECSFELIRNASDNQKIATVVDGNAVWSSSTNLSELSQEIISYLSTKYDISPNTSIDYAGVSSEDSLPSQWDTL